MYNGLINDKRVYPIELAMRRLSEIPGTYILAAFNSSREVIDHEDFPLDYATDEFWECLDDVADQDAFNHSTNLIITHATSPDVPLEECSRFNEDYFNGLERKI